MASIHIKNTTRVPVKTSSLRRFAARVLESTRDWRGAELSILLVGDRRIQSLNEQWRGRPRPTDVLSFPMDDKPAPGETLLIGDIVIGARQALADARDERVPLDDKLRELTLHSILHLMGYDHETPEQARRMERRRKTIIKNLESRL